MPSYKVTVYAPPEQTATTQHQTHGALALAPDPNVAPAPRPKLTMVRMVVTRRGPNEATVEDQLITEHYKVVSIREIDRIASWRTKFRAEKITLYRHLSRYLRKAPPIELGPLFLPMFRATSKFRGHASSFLRALEVGTVNGAMAMQPDVFADWECNLVEIGAVAGGSEPDMLDLLSKALRLENRIGRWAKQLAVYPSILALFITVAFIIYYGVMFPKLMANTQLTPGEQYPLYLQLIMLPYTLFSNLGTAVFTSGMIAITVAAGVAAYIFFPGVQYFVEYMVLRYTSTYGQILINGLQIRLLNILAIVLEKGQQDRAFFILQGAAVGRVATKALGRVYAASQAGGRSWAHALYSGIPILDAPTVARVIAAETIGAAKAMIEELRDITEEKEADSDILFEDLKTKLNSSMIIVFAAVIGLMYLGLYVPVQFFLTHAHGV